MFKTILIPIDMAHIEAGKSIIDIATAQGNEDTRVILINVVEDIPYWAEAKIPAGVLEKSKQYAHDRLKSIAQAIDKPLDILVRTGKPYRTILEAAEEAGADLIVIASHKPGMQDYFLGSTAAKVVRRASCSVLVVR